MRDSKTGGVSPKRTFLISGHSATQWPQPKLEDARAMRTTPPTIARRRRAALLLALVAIMAALLPGFALTTPGVTPATVPVAQWRPDDDEDDSDDTDEDDDSDDTDDESDDDDDDTSEDDEVDEDELPDNIKAILKKERQARRDAEKARRKAERDLKKAKGAKPPPKTKPKPKPDDTDEDDDKPSELDAGTQKLRRANLITALQEKGYTGKRAKAVSRLLDDVEFDDDDEPVDLDDALEAAEDEYGKQALAKGAKRTPPDTNGSDGKQPAKGPKLTAEEKAMAKRFGMTDEEWANYRSTTPTVPKPKAKKKPSDEDDE